MVQVRNYITGLVRIAMYGLGRGSIAAVGLAETIGSPLGQGQCSPVAVAIGNSGSMNTAPALGCGRWTSFGILRNTPEFPRELQAGAGELNDPVSAPWGGLAVRSTLRPGQRGQHHAPSGSVLGRLDQEFTQRDIDVDIVEFEVEGGPHVGGADRTIAKSFPTRSWRACRTTGSLNKRPSTSSG